VTRLQTRFPRAQGRSDQEYTQYTAPLERIERSPMAGAVTYHHHRCNHQETYTSRRGCNDPGTWTSCSPRLADTCAYHIARHQKHPRTAVACAQMAVARSSKVAELCLDDRVPVPKASLHDDGVGVAHT
jgi:hypothetical protein